MKDWKTSLSGIVAGLAFIASAIAGRDTLSRGQIASIVLAGIVVALKGIVSADATPSPMPPMVKAAGAAAMALAVALPFAISGCVNGKLDPRVPAIANAIEQAACTFAPLVVHGQTVGVACDDVAPAAIKILQAFAMTPARQFPTVAMPKCTLAPIVVRNREVGRVCITYSQELSDRLSADAVSK